MANDFDKINYNQKPSKVIWDLARKNVSIELYAGRKLHTEIKDQEVDQPQYLIAVVQFLDHLHEEKLI
jgi:hypothetical protein